MCDAFLSSEMQYVEQQARCGRFAAACLWGWVVLFSTPACGSAADDFEQVASIIQQRCLQCHNEADRKGDFSLQTAEDLSEFGLLDEQNPEESGLLAVVLPDDGEPPSMPQDGEPLSADEVEVIRRWIKSGAKWPADRRLHEPVVDDFDWWSFQPVQRPDIPAFPGGSAQAEWIRTPVDAFILAKLDEQGLTHTGEADRRTLIRRVTYDLTGLPPSPQDVRNFVADRQPRAYERLVDRLLSSPHYGERWARHWLDVVKYADTCGYDKDKLRPHAWPYRDYVIRSFNDDKPYRRFVHEQIAGDVLFPGTPDGILGLGFLATGPWDFIGHVEVPESKIDGQVARNLDRDEVVSNTLNTFCSATIQCARCHNHKFDPFTQEQYYGLQAVFAAVDRANRPYDLDPDVVRQRQQLAAQLDEAKADRTRLQQELQAAGADELVELQRAVADLEPRAAPQSKLPQFGYHSAIASDPDAAKWVQIDLGREVSLARIILRPCHDDYAGIGAGFGFPRRFHITGSQQIAAEDGQPAQFIDPITLADRTHEDVPNPGLASVELNLDGPKVRYLRVAATKLAERKDDFIFALAELQAIDAEGSNVARDAVVTSLDSIEAPVRWSRQNLIDGIWAAPQSEDAARQLKDVEAQLAALRDRINTPERRQRKADLDELIKQTDGELKSLPPGKLVYAAATAFKPQGQFKPTQGVPRVIKVLHRGSVQQPGEVARPGALPLSPEQVPVFSLGEHAAEGDRRAALAQWITRDDHPLTWRSIVNRVWQYHFGRGIVESPNDFGRMGQQPTHPQLFDWLAVEFRDKGQSFKQLHRMIVTSAAYRQGSGGNEANARIDGANRYLWRMTRRRLEAEEIRDTILSVSDRLNSQMGGPGFYLFALERTEHSPHYEYHKFDPEDAQSHRRAAYRFIVRSQPDPFMTTLDCADSSQSTPLRDETLTSLQALSLLNNRFNLSMSQHFARRLEREAASLSERVERALQLTLGRAPSAAESEQLIQYAQQHGLPNLCRVLFNLSEFVYLD